MIVKKTILLVLLLLFVCCQAKGQEVVDSVFLKVYFRVGHSTLDLTFRDNGTHLETFAKQMHALQQDTLYRIRKIRIVSVASPEGSSLLNKRLAQKRSEQLYAHLKQRALIDSALLDISSIGADWEGLSLLVEASDMPYRTEVLRILHHTPEWITKNGVIVDGRKRQLGMLKGGKVWAYMLQHFFPDLRSSDLRVICERERIPLVMPLPTPKRVIESLPVPALVVEPMPVATAQELERKPFYMSFKTNLLYSALLVPNVGVEFNVGRGWSVGANWMYAWWHSDLKHNYWRTYGGELNLRKYIGRKAAEKPLTGHHLGFYLQGLTYDFERGSTGYLSKVSYATGLEYGYTKPIGKRLNLDFSIGMGYLGGEYMVYDPIEAHYVWKETRQRHWIGPTKAEISLVWLIGHGNYNEKKGGRR